MRWGRDGSCVVAAVNFTPVPQMAYRLGVPAAGRYVEILNTDSTYYGGSNLGNSGALDACEGEWMNRPANLEITIPPLAAVVLRRSWVFGDRSVPGCRLPWALHAM